MMFSVIEPVPVEERVLRNYSQRADMVMPGLASRHYNVAQIRHIGTEFHHAATKIPIFKQHYPGMAVDTNRIDVDVFQVRNLLTRPIALFVSMKIVVLVDANPVAVVRTGCRKCRNNK